MPRLCLRAGLLGAGLLAWAASAAAADALKRPSGATFLFSEDTLVTGIDLSGPGSSVANLPTVYDLSLFEMNWGGKQSLINGAGITTNASYPLSEGTAITTQDRMGFSITLPHGMEAGLLWGLYAAGGSRPVGRTFGAQLPWDNAERSDERVLPPHVDSELSRAWLKGRAEPFTYQVAGGSLDVIELTRTEWNYLNLGSLLYRPPVATAGIFGKGDRRYQPRRHVMQGADAVGTWEYADGKQAKAELFFGLTKPTPVQEIDRDALGGRLSADVWRGNAGVTYVQSTGERNPAITGERQTLWALDGSYPLGEAAALYGAWAHTGYHRNGRLHGNAWVGGLRWLGPRSIEWRTQYQYLGENYDLMAYHKVEHYPSNFHGVNTSLTMPLGPALLQGTLYRLHQIETNTRPGDAIFGDSYFPALTGSARGDITAYRLGADYDLARHHDGLPKLSTYLEQVRFQKAAPDTADNDIDKLITNWDLLVVQPVVKGLTIEGGWRIVTASGRWQSMRFHHRQGIPEVSVVYRLKEPGKEKERFRAAVIYNVYDFVDSMAASSGRNNYQAHQATAELLWVF